jgi:glycosyltransferase involved in cell wall biosynthesis
MKIAYFCDEYPPRAHGGIGVFVKFAAESFSKKGHDVTVVEFGEWHATRKENGVKIVTLKRSNLPKIGWLISRLRLWLWLVSSGRNRTIDIFELPEFQGWLPIPLIFSGPLKIIIRLHQSGTALNRISNERPNKLQSACEYMTLRFHRNWVGVSRFILEQTTIVFGISPARSTVIYNPITVSPATRLEIEKLPSLPGPYILFVGSLTERKGVLTIAAAAREIFATHKTVQFVFIGEDTEKQGVPISAAISELVGQKNINRIRFLGRLPHKDSLYWMRHATAVVLPSLLESFGLVPVEAMSLGTPAIFTKESSGKEVITDGLDGYLISPGDVSTLKERVGTLLDDMALREQMSLAALESVKRFGFEEFMSACENAYGTWA